MLAFLRVFVFQWLLARIGLRWLVAALVVAPVALILLVGIPTVLALGLAGYLLWRFLKRESTP